MPVSLSIKNVPDDVAERLRERAKRNHRSLQGELLAMLEEGVEQRPMTPEEVLREVRALGIQTPDKPQR
ncbi:MAG: Arc family DNA-binding protein [Dehalococcoidia bacterium]|nr:Arc family DNA-binding protein [Dehalococcoidia bacterium]